MLKLLTSKINKFVLYFKYTLGLKNINNLNSYELGVLSEKIALKYLKQKYKILATNFKTKVGEVDIIAFKNNTIIAIEVKYRANQQLLEQSITTLKQKRVKRATDYYIKRYRQFQNCKIKFDVILINKNLQIKHVQNAWVVTRE